MAESPKRPADVSRTEADRAVKPAKPAAPSSETARAADSVPVAVGPFTVLPTQFGRYRIEKLLGKGAMGAVYLAHDIQLDRQVALKVARVSTSGSAKLIKRMETEAKAAAKVDHPQICKVYDFGEIDGIRFIALQYIEGEDLKSYLKRVGRKREPDEAIGWIVRLASALEAAHEKGVLHRDLKPENVMLNRKNEPVIMDFGLARSLTGATNAGLTQGMILGTAAYMSPEQAIGRAEGIDHRSDLYALGVMLFEMLTGEWPFTGSAIEVMGKKSVLEAPSPLSLNPSVPTQLAAICQQMIARKKEDRYSTCADVITALESVDLKAPVALEMEVEFDEAPSPSDFLHEPPALPVWHKLAKTKPERAKAAPILHRLDPLAKWWRVQPPAMRWTMLGSVGACAVILAAVLFFRSGNALVKVEILADDVEVTFHNETITLNDGAHKFKVVPGPQMLHIKSNNVEFDTDKFTLKRGENPTVTVELVNSEIVTKLGEREIGRRSLTVNSTGQADADRKAAIDSQQSIEKSEVALSPSSTTTPSPPGAKEITSAFTGMKLALIPAGTFLMGSSDAEVTAAVDAPAMMKRGREFFANEQPQHSVKISQPFYMGVNEVTQAEYERVMGTNPSSFSKTGSYSRKVSGMDTGKFPVENVSWENAQEFCRKLSRNDGQTYRLPTEAEWEYACRANTTTPFHFGGTLNGDKANVNGNYPFGTTTGKYLERPTTVGSYSANGFGLFDMHGNVWEWCDDVYDDSAYGKRSGTTADPKVITGSEYHVLRGGSWNYVSRLTRSACRSCYTPDNFNLYYGFRVVLPFASVRTP